MPSFGSPFQQNPDGAHPSQSGAGKPEQSQHQSQKLEQGFAFHTDNPHAQEFLRLRESGADLTRFKQVTVMMQNWEIGHRGDSSALRVAMKEALKAMEAKPLPYEDFRENSLSDVALPKFKQ